MPGNKPGGAGLLADDVDDVVTVPSASLAEESLHAIVVVGRVEAELPLAAAVGEWRVGWGDVPAGESQGAGFDVILTIIELFVHAHAQREQLQEFPPVVLVDCGFMAFGVVQVVDHARVLGEIEEQVSEAARALLPEHIDHSVHLVAAIYLGVAATENGVPKESHFLLELAGLVDHPVEPLLVSGLVRLTKTLVVAEHQVFFNTGLCLRIE